MPEKKEERKSDLRYILVGTVRRSGLACLKRDEKRITASIPRLVALKQATGTKIQGRSRILLSNLSFWGLMLTNDFDDKSYDGVM